MKLPQLVRSALLATLLASAVSVTLAQGTGPTPYPAKTDEAAWPGTGPIFTAPWMNDNRSWFWSQRANAQGAVFFVGDSLIGGWKGVGLAFPGIKVANRGIGGDMSRGVLFRIQEDVIDLQPRAIVFCVGSNDLSAHAKADDTISNISQIIDLARKADATVPIVLCTIPPRNMPTAPIVPGSLDLLNIRLKTYAQDKTRLVVLDLHAAFANADGTLNPTYIGKDGIHITPAGYEKWGTLLRPVLKSLGIEPAAKTP